MKILKIEACNFSSPPPPPLILKCTHFRNPPLIFSEPPFRVSKSSRSPPSISSSPLVILNELSLNHNLSNLTLYLATLYLIYSRVRTFHHFGRGCVVNSSQLCTTPDGTMGGCLITTKDSCATENFSWLECRVYDKYELSQVQYEFLYIINGNP